MACWSYMSMAPTARAKPEVIRRSLQQLEKRVELKLADGQVGKACLRLLEEKTSVPGRYGDDDSRCEAIGQCTRGGTT